jgi:hypothetical protein
MRRVIDYAKEKGLRRVYGDVLVKNTTMLQMCAEFGFHAEDMGSDLRRVVLDLENIGSAKLEAKAAGQPPCAIGARCMASVR